MDTQKAVDILRSLELRYKASPSVEDVANEAGVSTATAHKYLKLAVESGLIVQSKSRKFMTHEVASAFEQKASEL